MGYLDLFSVQFMSILCCTFCAPESTQCSSKKTEGYWLTLYHDLDLETCSRGTGIEIHKWSTDIYHPSATKKLFQYIAVFMYVCSM